MRGRRTVPPSISGMPQRRQFEAAGDRRPRDGGDDRLRQLEPGRSHWSARRRPTVFGKVEGFQRLGLPGKACGELQVPTGAKGPARAPEHRDRGVRVALEGEKGLDQRLRTLDIHGVARLGARMDDGGDGAVPFDGDAHGSSHLSLSRRGRHLS
jgi:hypothetical protein